ncbi:Serine/threonine-protein phosphatase rdgC [Clonorchis sinensis]|uniref:Serine/threonine-protein phosphatase rdgC n=2 Tax=Clonorchis sinensis TaxID=79923 RepID=A0A8T1MG56_CLOSI|nr:Serine/threonine-protein phosphatase rdgC [Clonorchis sinensis]GAA48872.1 retinal degeneration C protein [Clonorchis sinensis]
MDPGMQPLLHFRAAVLIQCWYRKVVAKLEIRRQCAWRVLQAFEYTRDEGDLNQVTEFFAELSRETAVSNVPCGAAAIWVDSSDEINFPLGQREFQNLLHVLTSTKKRITKECFERIVNEAASALQHEPNISEIQLEENSFVSICGDLHGNLQALLQFFNQNGLPSEKNRIIFNGDFVDRGYKSVEVLCILFAAYLAFPGCVFLNRGNHEDIRINELYGFKRELSWKYPNQESELLQTCSKAFSQLPVACIVDQTIFVCHGGVASSTDLHKVRTLDRSKLVSVFSPCLDGPKAVNLQDWEQLLNLLWSDPQEKCGASLNTFRGAGCCFGPDITDGFLQRYGLQLLIRSHQCIPEGWKLQHSERVLTVFSAYNYFGHNTNEGAYIRLSLRSSKSPAMNEPVNENTREKVHSFSVLTLNAGNAYYSNRSFKNRSATQVEVVLLERPEVKRTEKCSKEFTINAAFVKLWNHVLQFEDDIRKDCKAADKNHTGTIGICEWCDIMRKRTQLQLPWRFLRSYLVNTTTTNVSRVVYETMFTGLYVVHPKLKVNPELAKKLFYYQTAMKTLFEKFVPTSDSDSVDLTSVCKRLRCLRSSPKVKEMGDLIEKLAQILPCDECRRFSFREFFSGYQFVEISRRS